jgi:phosphate transport system substrate-binding protein
VLTSRWFLYGALFAVVGCGGGPDGRGDSASAAQASVSGSVDLTGAGATFPYPVYQKWFSDYAARTGVKINYQSIGSGGGIKQLQEQTVDFGASDAPMTDAELAAAKGGPIIHVPTVIGAVAITYNLPDVKTPLRLSGELLADIYLNHVRKWNDSRIAALNPGVALPNRDIIVVHRSEGSGTTYAFTDYLSGVSKAWAAGPGKGKDVQWPVGLGGKGNEAVAGQVKQTPGTIGFVELAYAKQNQLPTALLRNAAGNFVEPSVESAGAAAKEMAGKIPPGSDYRVSIVNAPGAASYPISSFTWLLIYKNPTDPEKAKKLNAFLRWALTEGEGSAAVLDYAPLPTDLRARLTARLDSVAIGGAK